MFDAQVCYTDICCGDRPFLQRTLAQASVAIEDDAHSRGFADETDALPLLEFPAGFKVILLTVTRENCDDSARLCMSLLQRARGTEPAVLGFDIEYSVRPSGPRPVATLQLSALDGFTVLFHLKPNDRKDGIMPTALKELLVNDTVQLVSCFFVVRRRSNS